MSHSSAKTNKAFRHSRLRSPRCIRLATLLPSANDDKQVEVILSEIELDSSPASQTSYEALSYVWGSRDGTLPVLCDSKILLVTSNCLSALQHLRLPDVKRVLWVDAICINQEQNKDGLDERATQVPLMGEIYASAQRTLCWLGGGLEYTGLVMRHLKQIGECPSQRGLAKLLRLEGEWRLSSHSLWAAAYEH